MQPDLKARLEAEAEKAGRSLNAEIVSRLEETLKAGGKDAQVVDQGTVAYELIAERTLEKLLESERFLQSIDRLRKTVLDDGTQLSPPSQVRAREE